MQTVIVARHAESECSDRGIVNGEPNHRCPLTEHGEEQARALGRSLLERQIDLYVTSEFPRARRTAEIALEGRELPWLELAELNDIRVGAFEGGPLEQYTTWAHTHEPEEQPPGGGESRSEAAVRFARGLRIVLTRTEPTILVVTHGLAVRFLLEAAAGQGFHARHVPVPYARPFEFGAEELAQALDRLEAWQEDPRWSE
ncbi:MAG TPA: histidine phosphatase family protein [Gaiellaceae bacterium]